MTVSHHIPPIAANDYTQSRALILAGGGMRVAYQAGVIQALSETGMRFSHADGASGGTINLAALLSGISPVELCQRWRTLNIQQFASLPPLNEVIQQGGIAALGSADGLTQHIYPGLGIDIPRINAASGINATFNVCRFDTKTVVPIPHTEINLPRLIAGASLPIFMPAVEDNGVAWTDAVWIQDANLLAAVEHGARELWLVWCIGNTSQYKHDLFRQYVHMIEMSAIGALNRELATIAQINARIAQGEVIYGHIEPIVVHIIKPEYPLPLDPDFYLGRIDAATLIDLGYRDTRHYLRTMTPHGTLLDASATQMKTPSTGISFRETMSGGFQLGSVLPAEGAQAGCATPLSMHATIHIRDIHAFVADPSHKAELSGHIDFAPFNTTVNTPIPAESGLFQLFAPSDDPKLTYMVYELGFRHEGESYYLAGKKHVRVGAPWKLWSETTTLYSTLHRGTDSTGPVIGAGILQLGVSELLKLLSTFHPTEADTPCEAACATKQFFGFFAKELTRTYICQRPLAPTSIHSN